MAYCITGFPLAITWRFSSLNKQPGNVISLYWPDEIVSIGNSAPSKQVAGKKYKISRKCLFVVSFDTLMLCLDSYMHDSVVIVSVIERANAIQKLFSIMDERIEKRLLNGF